jgi:ubiquinone/menaquinone biosynthesis C-methylase UbiE
MAVDQLSSRQRWRLEATVPEAYERFLVPVLFAPLAERLLELVAPGPGERVLDVACGTGIVARRAAPLVGPRGTVTGLDLNLGMLEVARAAAAQVHTPIAWWAGDATHLPLGEGVVDVVMCQQSLQFFPDRTAALREMRRVLAPEGRLALAVWRPIRHSPGFAALTQALERHVGADAAAIMRAPFDGPDAATLRRLVLDAGFGEVRLRIGFGAVRFPSAEAFLGQQAASSPLAGPVGALGREVHEALARDLDWGLHAYVDDDGVVFPMQTWLVTGRRWERTPAQAWLRSQCCRRRDEISGPRRHKSVW